MAKISKTFCIIYSCIIQIFKYQCVCIKSCAHQPNVTLKRDCYFVYCCRGSKSVIPHMTFMKTLIAITFPFKSKKFRFIQACFVLAVVTFSRGLWKEVGKTVFFRNLTTFYWLATNLSPKWIYLAYISFS